MDVSGQFHVPQVALPAGNTCQYTLTGMLDGPHNPWLSMILSHFYGPPILILPVSSILPIWAICRRVNPIKILCAVFPSIKHFNCTSTSSQLPRLRYPHSTSCGFESPNQAAWDLRLKQHGHQHWLERAKAITQFPLTKLSVCSPTIFTNTRHKGATERKVNEIFTQTTQ